MTDIERMRRAVVLMRNESRHSGQFVGLVTDARQEREKRRFASLGGVLDELSHRINRGHFVQALQCSVVNADKKLLAHVQRVECVRVEVWSGFAGPLFVLGVPFEQTLSIPDSSET